MGHKDNPILKKKIVEMLKHIPAIERLSILEPLCERYRKESRTEVLKDTAEFSRRKGIPLVKTDY